MISHGEDDGQSLHVAATPLLPQLFRTNQRYELREARASLRARLVDHSSRPGECAATHLDEQLYGTSLAARLDPIVHQEEPVAGGDAGALHSKGPFVPTVVSGRFHLHLVAGKQPTWFSNGHEPDPELKRDCRPEDEATRFDGDDARHAIIAERLRHRSGHIPQQLTIAEHRPVVGVAIVEADRLYQSLAEGH